MSRNAHKALNIIVSPTMVVNFAFQIEGKLKKPLPLHVISYIWEKKGVIIRKNNENKEK